MDDGGEVAIDAVRRYAAAYMHMRLRLFEGYPELGGVRDLMAAVRHTRTMPREARSSTGIDYCVHGAGCRMTDDQGQEIDVDLVDDVEAFDAWRVKWFLDKGGDARPSMDELGRACAYLANLGELLEVRAGRWYAVRNFEARHPSSEVQQP